MSVPVSLPAACSHCTIVRDVGISHNGSLSQTWASLLSVGKHEARLRAAGVLRTHGPAV